MDDSELIRRMKGLYKKGKTREEVTRKFLAQGYKLEYINVLDQKAHPFRKPFLMILFGAVIIFVLVSGYVLHSILDVPSDEGRKDIVNPFSNTLVSFGPKQITPSSNSISGDVVFGDAQESTIVHIDDIVITPDFVSYILHEIGAWKLKPTPITGSKPILNFDVDGRLFYSTVSDSKITTFEGFSDSPDVTLYSDKKTVVDAVVSDDPKRIFQNSFDEGRSTLTLDASEVTLFSKGYFSLYESLHK